MPVTLAAIEDARRRIAGSALRTPLVRLNCPDAAAEIYLKLENLQPIGSFKIRGAANAMARLSEGQLRRGVLTASAGNMAQGVAWRARELGVPCTVVAPDTAPAVKLRTGMRKSGRSFGKKAVAKQQSGMAMAPIMKPREAKSNEVPFVPSITVVT